MKKLFTLIAACSILAACTKGPCTCEASARLKAGGGRIEETHYFATEAEADAFCEDWKQEDIFTDTICRCICD